MCERERERERKRRRTRERRVIVYTNKVVLAVVYACMHAYWMFVGMRVDHFVACVCTDRIATKQIFRFSESD